MRRELKGGSLQDLIPRP